MLTNSRLLLRSFHSSATRHRRCTLARDDARP